MSEDKYGNQICELLESELDEYPFFEGWSFSLAEIFDGWEYYDVQIRCANHSYLLRTNGDRIQVQYGEDSWEDIRTYDWTIKYFWMTILSWDELR